MSLPAQTDPIDPMLREAEAELHRRLHEACEAEASDMRTESSEEIRRIEDSLLQAVVAAEQTIMLRRQRQKRDAEQNGEAMRTATGRSAPESAAKEEPAEAPVASAEQPATAVREFRDGGGVPWRAWSVTPGLARPSGYSVRYLGEYHKGWLCFEALEGAGRRRLPSFPQDWTGLDERGLATLLQQAIAAPDRKSGVLGKAAGEGERAPAAGA